MYETFEVQPTVAAPNRHITQYAFRTRVGDALVASMELAAVDNPALDQPARLLLAKERARQARCFAAEYLDLDDAELRAGFAGVPVPDFNRIFTVPVRPHERLSK